MGDKYHKSKEEIAIEERQIREAQQAPEKFDVLYDKYYKMLFLFLFKRTRDEELTADLTSQVFLKAMLHIKRYQFRGLPFSSWLFRIALNEVHSHYRKQSAHRFISIDKTALRNLLDVPEEEDIDEQFKKVEQAMAKLDEAAVSLLELRFFEKKSFKEIGTIFGITENNAKVRAYRALEKLKKIVRKISPY